MPLQGMLHSDLSNDLSFRASIKADLKGGKFETQRVSVSAVSKSCWAIGRHALQLLNRQGEIKLTDSPG